MVGRHFKINVVCFFRSDNGLQLQEVGDFEALNRQFWVGAVVRSAFFSVKRV